MVSHSMLTSIYAAATAWLDLTYPPVGVDWQLAEGRYYLTGHGYLAGILNHTDPISDFFDYHLGLRTAHPMDTLQMAFDMTGQYAAPAFPTYRDLMLYDMLEILVGLATLSHTGRIDDYDSVRVGMRMGACGYSQGQRHEVCHRTGYHMLLISRYAVPCSAFHCVVV